MNLLTNICNPKQQHFEQQAKTQTYKPMNDYVFQNRAMQKMRARYEVANNPQQFKYQSWNHPYSISNYFMQHKAPNLHINQHSTFGSQQHMNYSNDFGLKKDGINGSKKISFKQIPNAICGIGKEQEGEKLFSGRDQFYASLKNDHINNLSANRSKFNINQSNINEEKYHQTARDNPFTTLIYSRQNQNENNNNTLTQAYQSHALFNKQIVELKRQNKQLKRIIDDEYKPMKALYNKLLSEQEEREYLISKLEWKVKQLVKQMGGNSGLYANGQVFSSQTNRNQQFNKQKIGTIKVDRQKTINYHPQYQAKNFDEKNPIVKMDQSKMNNFINHPTQIFQNKSSMLPITRQESQKSIPNISPLTINNQPTNQVKNFQMTHQHSNINTNQINSYSSKPGNMMQNNYQPNFNLHYASTYNFQVSKNQNNGVLIQNNPHNQFISNPIGQHSTFEIQKGINNQINMKRNFY